MREAADVLLADEKTEVERRRQRRRRLDAEAEAVTREAATIRMQAAG